MITYSLGLIGDPVSHSCSPRMQDAAFAHLGLAAKYELWPTTAAALPARIAQLREPKVLGANVTLPHKTAVISFLDTLEPEAALIGAVNTIYKLPNGDLVGANTDAPAFLTALQEEGQFVPAGQKVVILGASGAARAVAYTLAMAGVTQLVLANRTLAKAEDLLADLLLDLWGAGEDSPPKATCKVPSQEPQLIATTLDDSELRSLIAESSLLVNATSIGWQADETPLADPPVKPGILIYDLVYRPTRLLHEGASRGAQVLDGRGMLVHQGALAFTRWTGKVAPITVMRQALDQALRDAERTA